MIELTREELSKIIFLHYARVSGEAILDEINENRKKDKEDVYYRECVLAEADT